MIAQAHKQVWQALRKKFKNKKISIVDYGCGDGALLELIPQDSLSKYIGLDVNRNSLENARKKHSQTQKISFKKINTKNLPKFGQPKSIDAVVLIGSLQYMKPNEQEHLIAESQKALKKNGLLIITCAVDHLIYRLLNIYQLFLPNYYIQRSEIEKLIKKSDFKILELKEKGLIFSPLFSNIFIFFFDAFDKILFRTKGSLGPIGNTMRKLMAPVIALEWKLTFNYGYTLIIVAQKT